MSLRVNLRHLEAHNVRLEGRLPAGQLDIETRDDIIQLACPLDYALEVQKLDGGLLIQGRLSLLLDCKCVRCLKPFQHHLQLAAWTCHVPLHGDEALPISNDCVDLTPLVREDILLEFPQHPLCQSDCRGLRGTSAGKSRTFSSIGLSEEGSPAWKALNKLKF